MPMSKTVLVTRPQHDQVTNYLFSWTQLVLDEATRKGFTVFDLYGNKANKITFISYINKRKPSLIFLNGHGSDSVITGHDNEPLVSNDDGVELLAGKVVYARSCDAGKDLGVQSIKHGALAFIGYKEKFFLVTIDDKLTRPLEDPIARLFLEPSNLIPISLIKGNSVKEAYNKSQKASLRNLSYMLSTAATAEERDSAPFLYSNKLNQVVLGDKRVRLS